MDISLGCCGVVLVGEATHQKRLMYGFIMRTKRPLAQGRKGVDGPGLLVGDRGHCPVFAGTASTLPSGLTPWPIASVSTNIEPFFRTGLAMLRRLLITASVVTLGALLSGCATPAAPVAQKARIVLQVSDNDPAKWNLALNNARNAQNDLGKDKVDLEIVAYGPGINMLKMDATIANRVSQAIGTGISIVACENTMTAQKIVKADMNPSVTYVPAGVIQLMKRQQQGWAYIRP
jgi:uncharacterized protein